MSKTLSIEQFFTERNKDIVLMDVRSPLEYSYGHIPGAISFPLFTDEERAIVGKTYKQIGRQSAIIKGLELVGNKMSDFVKRALKLSRGKKIIMYCWRGGMRSGSMAWLLRTSGIEVDVLQGGYKAYRSFVQNEFKKNIPLLVLGGYTGSGKTELLNSLKEEFQCIDLEYLASHKGSAFGWNGNQPSSEQFENLLFEKLIQSDYSKPIWVEDESRTIGKVYIPSEFWHKMRHTTVLKLLIHEEIRTQNIIEEYGKLPQKYLLESIQKIEKRIGNEQFKIAYDACIAGDYKKVVQITLKYYDKAYDHGLSKRENGVIVPHSFESLEKLKSCMYEIENSYFDKNT